MPNLTIRNMDPDILARFNRAAGARGLTQREYLAALVKLHSALVEYRAENSADTDEALDILGLGPVTT